MVAWDVALLPLPLTNLLAQCVLQALCQLLFGAHGGEAPIGEHQLYIFWLEVLQDSGYAGIAVESRHGHTRVAQGWRASVTALKVFQSLLTVLQPQ